MHHHLTKLALNTALNHSLTHSLTKLAKDVENTKGVIFTKYPVNFMFVGSLLAALSSMLQQRCDEAMVLPLGAGWEYQ